MLFGKRQHPTHRSVSHPQLNGPQKVKQLPHRTPIRRRNQRRRDGAVCGQLFLNEGDGVERERRLRFVVSTMLSSMLTGNHG